MSRLRRRLCGRFGPLSNVPAFQMLLLDTDLKAILKATQGDENTALDASETLAVPLRRTQDYRTESSRYLRWLSRRWLYNIPRSLQTEGRRPLGRLAFVDHAERITDRVRTALAEITSPEAVAATAEKLGAPFCEKVPRVFLVASISGGTGSGMVLDVAYAVRCVLAELGLSDEGLRGVLTHSVARAADARDLAIANAYALLTELRHYRHPSLSYPGAPECKIPPCDEGGSTFPDTYLVHLGQELSEDEFDASTDSLAEYLYLDTASV